MKRRFANVLVNMNVNSSGNLDTYNLFANLLFIDNIEDSCTMSLSVFLIHEKGTTDKFRGINDRHRRYNLPIICRVMTRLDDGRGNIARLQWIKSKVLSVQVKSQSDIGSMDKLESVIHQNLKGHGMSDRLADTDEINDDNYEEILSYNELMDYIEKDKQQNQDEDGNGFWNFKRIVGHEGLFRASDPEYKGSRYNILVEWENGEITSEPLNIFGKDDPVTCAVYACKHRLLEEEGWK
jgi:hypothetical protein